MIRNHFAPQVGTLTACTCNSTVSDRGPMRIRKHSWLRGREIFSRRRNASRGTTLRPSLQVKAAKPTTTATPLARHRARRDQFNVSVESRRRHPPGGRVYQVGAAAPSRRQTDWRTGRRSGASGRHHQPEGTCGRQHQVNHGKAASAIRGKY